MATSSSVTCGVCDAQHITNCADYWCPECEEGLCSECHKHHSVSKASRTHGCIPIDQYKRLPSSISKINHYCEGHGNKFTNYCSQHDQLCCPFCISTTHAGCKGFLSIQEIIKTAKTSTLLDNMEQSLADIENNIEKVIQNREHNMSKIGQQRRKFHDHIKKLRNKINSYLDSMELRLIAELNDAEKKLLTKIELLIYRLYKERASVHDLKICIQTLKEHATDLQTFVGSKMYQSEVEKAEKYMKSLSEDGSLQQLDLQCKTDDSLLVILRTFSFGSVSINTGSPSLVLKTAKEKQAQIMAVTKKQFSKSINDIKLSLLQTYNIPYPGVTGYGGCTIPANGKMILTDHCNSKLIILNDDASVYKDIPCSSRANDVTTIDDNTVAVTTENGINILNIISSQIEKEYTTFDKCHGITYHKGTLLFCEECKGLRRLDLSDWSITTLVKQDQLPEDSCVTIYEDKLFQTNYRTQTVTCYTINGEKCWEYQNLQVLKDPVGVTVDNSGNIYVTSTNSNHIVVISADGKEGKQLLGRTNRIDTPWGIYYNKLKKTLLIVNNKGPAFLYRVS